MKRLLSSHLLERCHKPARICPAENARIGAAAQLLTLYRKRLLRYMRWWVQPGSSGGGIGFAAEYFGARLAGCVKLKSSPTTSMEVWPPPSAARRALFERWGLEGFCCGVL